MITIQSPALLEDCWEFAGERSLLRKHITRQHQTGESVLISDDGEPVALAFIVPEADGRREFCLALSSRARARMRELCRAAQLILRRMAEDGPIISYVVPENRAGVRMARIVGFSPDPDHRYRWIMEPGHEHNQGAIRGRREQGG